MQNDSKVWLNQTTLMLMREFSSIPEQTLVVIFN